MNILLDTCTYLYAVLEDNKLSILASELIEDTNNKLFLSAISAYEIIVKYKLGKLKLDIEPTKFIPKFRNKLGIIELPIREQEILLTSDLPAHHSDPFDRIIISQALASNLIILTPDKLISAYTQVKSIW